MNIDKAQSVIKEVLSKDRYDHTLRVVDTALSLAEIYGEPKNKVTLAALLHDYAKCFTIDELKNNIIKYELPKSLLHYHFELWHAPVGSKILEDQYELIDEDVVNAIRYHTTGRKHMSQLEYIIFVADYTEPGRNFNGVQEVRDLSKVDLRIATRKALQNTIIYLLQNNGTVHPDSFLAYNVLTETIKER